MGTSRRALLSLCIVLAMLFISAPFLLGAAFNEEADNPPEEAPVITSLLELFQSAETTQSVEATEDASTISASGDGKSDVLQPGFRPPMSPDAFSASGVFGDEMTLGPLGGGPLAGILSAGTAIQPYAAATSSNLTDFVEVVQMYDMSTDPPTLVPSGGATILGGNYRFAITFAETSQLQMAYDTNGFLTYQLPADLTILNPVEQTPFYSPVNGDRIIGWYTISTSGLVEMWFDNVDMSGNPTPGGINLIDYYANVSITLNVFAQLTGGSDGNIDFGGGVIVEIAPPVKPDPSLTMHKASRYVPTPGPGTLPERIEYMLTITALGGPIDNVFVLDTPTIDAGSGPVSFADSSVFNSFRYYFDGDPHFTPFTPSWLPGSDLIWTHSFGDFVLEEGHSITIRYYVDIPALVSLNIGTDQPLDGMSEIIYNFFVLNTAYVAGQDYGTGLAVPPVFDSTTDNVRKDFVLNKTGEYISNTNQIQWSVTVGDGQSTVLNGGTITDIIDSRLTLVDDSEITIQFIDQSGTIQSFTATELAAMTPPLYERDPIPAGQTDPINGFTVTVPPNAIPWAAFYQVIITYTTEIDPGDIPQQGEPPIVFGNDIYFQFPDGGPGIEGGTQVPIIADRVDMNKTTSGICGRPDLSPAEAGPNGELYYVDYVITVDVPAGLQGQPLYLYDNLGLSPGGLGVANVPVLTDVSVEGSEVASIPLQNTSAIPYSTQPTVNAWKMFFGATGDTEPIVWGWQYNDEITLTVEYRIWLDQAAVNGLRSGRQLQNTAYLINGLGSPNVGALGNAVGSIYVTDLWPIIKGVQKTANPALFNYTVDIKGNYSTRASSLLEGKAPLFTDTFDSRLEYVPNSFYIVNTNTPGYYYVPNSDVTALSGTFTVALADGNWTQYQGQFPSGSNPQPATGEWFGANYTYEAHYQLIVSEAYRETAETISLANTAAIEVNPGECKFEASQAVPYVQTRMDKSMNPTAPGSDLVDVEIVINPDGSIEFSDPSSTASPPTTITASDFLRNLAFLWIP
ncbi:MAG: hypothetical protein FWE26_05815 [Coriobacteriia bacterium]|nr:hypothetical protein [Coriobacteriia bacterium]